MLCDWGRGGIIVGADKGWVCWLDGLSGDKDCGGNVDVVAGGGWGGGLVL